MSSSIELKRAIHTPNISAPGVSSAGAGHAPLQDGWRPAASAGIAGHRFSPFGGGRSPKISKSDLVHLTSQLAIMTRSGVDVATALESLARQARRPDTQQILSAIHRDVTSGKSFSVALRHYEKVFGASYVASVTAGEASGRMWDVLAHLAKLQRSELKLRSTIRTLVAYPIVLSSVSCLVISALVFFVLPQFAKIFAEFDTPLPFITRVLIGFSGEITSRFWLWIPLFAGAIFGTHWFFKTTRGRHLWDRTILNLVGIREITRSLMVGRICRMLGMLIDSGVPLLESLVLVKDSVRNTLFHKMFCELEQNVLSGRGLGTTLIESEFIPPSAAEMVLTAERTGTLGSVTKLIGEYFEEEGEEKLRGLIVIVEPAITVIMGIVVAFVVLAVALPMFDIATFAQK